MRRAVGLIPSALSFLTTPLDTVSVDTASVSPVVAPVPTPRPTRPAWLVPALLVGGGALVYFLFLKKKRR